MAHIEIAVTILDLGHIPSYSGVLASSVHCLQPSQPEKQTARPLLTAQSTKGASEDYINMDPTKHDFWPPSTCCRTRSQEGLNRGQV